MASKLLLVICSFCLTYLIYSIFPIVAEAQQPVINRPFVNRSPIGQPPVVTQPNLRARFPSLSRVKSLSMILPGHQQPSVVKYIERNGEAIYEGDINLGAIDRLGKPKETGQVSTSRNDQVINGVGITQLPLVVHSKEEYRWPGGIIPYAYGDGFLGSVKTKVISAINAFTNTNLKFVQRTNEKDYIQFVIDNRIIGTGQSYVGRQGGGQKVKLRDFVETDTIIHEILHAVGVWHEQSRWDRDSYVKVLLDNVRTEAKGNFDKHDDGTVGTPYDFNSIMHYASRAFGKVDPTTGLNLPTLQSLVAGKTISPSGTLSSLDIQGLNDIYLPNDCGNAPILFEDESKQGLRVSLAYSRFDLHRTDGFGDKASSICIPLGWSVTLYEHSDYGGRSLNLTGPITIHDLKNGAPDGINWGNKISSVHVNGVSANLPPSVCTSNPVVYENEFYRGRNLVLTHNIRSLHRDNMGDKISSICVPAGWFIELFEHHTYGGEVMRINGPVSIADLKRDSPDDKVWGDMFSSIHVAGPGANAIPSKCTDEPTLFENENYLGIQFGLINDARNLHGHGFGDKASSLCIPQNWRVTLFEDANYRGDRQIIDGPINIADLELSSPDHKNWNDRISSMHVVPPGGAPQNNCNQPILYEDIQFRGSEFKILRGHMNLHPYRWGDKASSICVPADWTIEIYEDINRGGLRLSLPGPILVDNLHQVAPDGNSWGDKISSVRVTRRPTGSRVTLPCSRPTLYHDKYYGDTPRRYSAGDSVPNLNNSGDNDKFSSVCVPSGFTLRVYEHKDFGGNGLILRGPREILNLKDNNWNDKISSLKVD